MSHNYFEKRRKAMVEMQLERRGIRDKRVLDAMRTVPRHLFVSKDMKERAYDDCALPIGEDQTISQPYMVACMTELLSLSGSEKVLEVGTGSGYQSAVLSVLSDEVHTVERIMALASRAESLFKDLNYDNVHVYVADGTLGLPEQAPFDCILVTAGAPDIPQSYIDQMNIGGRLVIPVGSRYAQVLYLLRKKTEGIEKLESTGCVFVPLLGENGWK